METNDRITVILTHLRKDVSGIYAQRKLDELDKELRTQDWEDFVKEIKTTFSDKTKAADATWKIKSFKQGKRNIVDFCQDRGRWTLFYFLFSFYFILFFFYFSFLFLEQLGLGLIGHAVTSVTS